jgi:hypothetical protein
MRTLFPELAYSTNINFMSPSKKGIRRFPSADPTPQPIDISMSVDEVLQTITRAHVVTVADVCLRLVPQLLFRLSDRQKARREWTVTFSNKLDAVRKVHGFVTKHDAGYWCIQNLMSAPTRANEPKQIIFTTRFLVQPLGNPFDEDVDDSNCPSNIEHSIENNTSPSFSNNGHDRLYPRSNDHTSSTYDRNFNHSKCINSSKPMDATYKTNPFDNNDDDDSNIFDGELTSNPFDD